MNTLDYLELERKLDPVSKKGFKVSFKKSSREEALQKKPIKIIDKSKKSHLDRESILERLLPSSKTEIQLLNKSPVTKEATIIPYTITESEKEREDYETFSKTVLDRDIESRKRKIEDEEPEQTEKDEELEEAEEQEEPEKELKEPEKELKEPEEPKEPEKETEEEEKEPEQEPKTTGKKQRKTRKSKEPTTILEEPENEGFLQVKIGKTNWGR